MEFIAMGKRKICMREIKSEIVDFFTVDFMFYFTMNLKKAELDQNT